MNKQRFLQNNTNDWFVKNMIGEFENEFGEEYIVSHYINHYWIAGDETAWQIMVLDKSGLFAYETFQFNEVEVVKLKRILREEGKK